MQRCVLRSPGPRGNSALIARLPRLAPGKPRFGSSTCPGGKNGSRGKLRNSWICLQGRGKRLVLRSSAAVMVTVESCRLVLVAADLSRRHHTGP